MRRWLRLATPLLPVALITAAFAQPAPPAATATAAASASGAETAPAPSVTAQHAAMPPAFPVEEVRLRNGLRVIFAPDDALPDVTVYLRYDVGSRDEPDGLRGIAHLVEHLMFQESTHVPRGEFLHMLSRGGVTDVNGMTTYDATIYYETVPPERLELALWLESDRMGYFAEAVDEAALKQERNVVLTERRTRYVDPPLGMAPLFVSEATFPSWHPYHGAPAGNEDDIGNITLADVRAFFATWYGPGNATLVLAGRFEKDAAAALVQRYFATLPARPPPARPALPPLTRKGPTRVEVGANVLAERLDLTWVTPAGGSPADAALDFAAALLTRGETSRLQQRLVASGIAAGVDAEQWSRKLASVFQIRVLLSSGRTAEEARDAVDQELAQLAASGPTKAELAGVRSYWTNSDLFFLETSLGRAVHVGITAALGALPEPFDWLDRRKTRLTAADVREAVTKHLSPQARAAEVLSRRKRREPVSGVVTRRQEP
jgi:zinc protease